ncbi:MAG: glycosyltransferase family 39 protein [Acidobacteriota bacterium]|nr:glycosyltransferase family 39 protein [Acidobacteriota bacterium]
MSRPTLTGFATAGAPALIATVLFIAVAVVAVMVVPDRAQWVIHLASGGANEIVLPAGYWAIAIAWIWLLSRTNHRPLSQVAPAAIVVAVVFHLLLLLAMFVPQFSDPARFSTGFYLLYARVFCGLVLASAGAWSTESLRGAGRFAATPLALAMPVAAGTVILAIGLLRYDPAVGVAGLVLALVLRWGPAGFEAAGSRWSTMARRVWQVAADERVFVVAVFLVALVLRLLYLSRVMTDPNYVATGGDGPIYDSLAWSIAQGDGVPVSFREGYPLLLLGYVWFVGAVYAIAGHSYFVIGAVQAVLGALACVLTFWLGRRLFGAAVGRLAAVFTAVSFPLLFAAAAIGHQAVDVFLTILIAWLLVRTIDRRKAAGAEWLGIGVLLGCAVAVRETSAFFLVFVLGWIPFAFKRQGLNRPLRAAALVLGGVILVVTPLLLPSVSTESGRVRLRQHFDRLYTGQGDAVRTRKDLVGPLEDPSAAVAQFRQQPALVTVTLGQAIAHNFAVQFFTQPFGGFDLVFLAKGSAYYYGLWFYAYVLAGVGTVLAFRLVRTGGATAMGIALVLGLITSRTLPHLILESHYRHRVPIEPFLILMAALAAVITAGRVLRSPDHGVTT